MIHETSSNWTRTSRLIKAHPEELYTAFIEPDSLVEWLPPAEMTGRIGAQLSLEQLARRFESA